MAVVVAVVAAIGTAAGVAQAAQRPHHARRPALAGSYSGHIRQLVPEPYRGQIGFVVRHGKIISLTFTVRAGCNGLSVVDTDHALPSLPVRVRRSGAFSFTGTVAHRLIRFSGVVHRRRARGKFFQSFPWGQESCSMVAPATFVATR